MLFDLDGFRRVNERYGHQAGDEVLIRLAQDVGATVRRNESGRRRRSLHRSFRRPRNRTRRAEAARAGTCRCADFRFFRRIAAFSPVRHRCFPEHALNAEELRQYGMPALHEVAGGRQWLGLLRSLPG